jgi:ribosomal protein S18 acetylase RimI-like enzyme
MITIKENIAFQMKDLLELYRSVGWKAYTEEPMASMLGKAIRNSTYVVTAWDGDQLVGLARGISDDVSIFYLQDILIHPDYQRRGIGKTLFQGCLDRYKHVRMKVLLTDDRPDQLHFYESAGFTNINHLPEENMNAFVMIK